jgi:hypothetical protein
MVLTMHWHKYVLYMNTFVSDINIVTHIYVRYGAINSTILLLTFPIISDCCPLMLPKKR